MNSSKQENIAAGTDQRLSPIPPEPGPGEPFPDTEYFRCDAECKVVKGKKNREKRACDSDDKNPCRKYDPKEPWRCHCVPFQYKDKKWKPIPRDDDGEFEKDDDVNQKCFCVRTKLP
jgi:hypothetical protein